MAAVDRRGVKAKYPMLVKGKKQIFGSYATKIRKFAMLRCNNGRANFNKTGQFCSIRKTGLIFIRKMCANAQTIA